MLSRIQDWFSKQLEASQVDKTHTLEIATAVLLYEVMRADNKFEQAEREAYQQQLNRHFTLSADEFTSLCELTEQHAEEAADYQQFTRVINEHCDPVSKRTILDSLWKIAYSDHELSPDEDYTIRKIADLLYIPHSQFIQSKLSIKPD